MITIINKSKDPRFNLALEEYVLKYLPIKEDIVMLWQNEPSIIIGRNQNTIEEINASFVKKHNINVVRRISGGGAVYHDLGNLNFTFVTDNTKDNLNNFRKFTQPVIDALRALGVPAEFAGRNDIVVEGKKISGNAQSFWKGRMFHHGTILFDANLEVVQEALNVKIDKIESKGIKSVRSRVTNILPYLKEKMTVEQFEQHLLKFLLGTDDIESMVYCLTNEDLEKINQLKKEKYDTWKWNYGESPEFTVVKEKRYQGGKVSFKLNVIDGIIKDIRIYGDFFGKLDVKDIEEGLIGKLFKEDIIKEELTKFNLEDYFFNITLENLIDCLFY